MNEREPRDEANLARLIRAGLGPEARPDSRMRAAGWERLRSLAQAERPRAAAAEPALALTDPPANHRRGSEPKQLETKNERSTLMNLLLKNRWGFGLGAAAVAAAVVGVIALSTPKAQAKAADVMSRGAQAIARLTSIHLRGQLRTAPADNFAYINPDLDFQPIELWKQFQPELKWRVEKPGRVVVMDGQTTVHYLKSAKEAVKLPHPARSAFDTDWLHRIANLSQTISNELRQAQAKGWLLDLTQETAPDGRLKDLVTVLAKSGLPEDDYVKNKFFEDADTRRVYRFDDLTERLEGVQVFLQRQGSEIQIFELTQIDYDQPIPPETWQLELPADVYWHQPPPTLPDNEKYAAMTAEQAARAFFEACGREDWAEAGKFMAPINEDIKRYLGGLEIVSLGTAFTSKAYGGRFVPYEIQLRAREFQLRLSNANPAKRYVLTGVCDSQGQLQQEIKWANAPAVLPNDSAYAGLSAAEAAKAYCAALARLDWAALGAFLPETDVEKTRQRVEEAQKSGIDPRNFVPQMEAGEAAWSAEQGAYLVKSRILSIKKHNLALRNDNPAHRWQVDGGI